MDPVGAMEERIVTERIRRKLEEVNAAAQQHLAGVQDHVNFTMQVRGKKNPSSGCPPLPARGEGVAGARSLRLVEHWLYSGGLVAVCLFCDGESSWGGGGR